MAKILIADSASITEFILGRFIGHLGFEIVYIRYARDLIARVKVIMPHIIFMEAEIAGGKGKKICEYLHMQPETRHIPIILLTRIADTNKHNMANWPGVHRLLRKPLSSRRVMEAIDTIHIISTQDLKDQLSQSEVG